MINQLQLHLYLTLTTQGGCSGAIINFVLSSATTNGVSLAAGTIVNWQMGNGFAFAQTIGTATTTVTYPYMYYTDPSGPVSFTATATILNPNSCIGTVTRTVTVIITPGPLATDSIATGSGNVFCTSPEVNSYLEAATSSGAIIAWYKFPSTPVGAGTSSLHITATAPFGAGRYFFKATLNGCTTRSNYIDMYVVSCDPIETCHLNPEPQVSVDQLPCATTGSPAVCEFCGTLNLLATTSIAPMASYWTVVGPDDNANVTNVTGESLYEYIAPVSAAGTYHIRYKAEYLCEGNPVVISATTDVIIPYVAAFTTAVTCNGSNYTIAMNDTSSFITTVTNRHYFYAYSTDGGLTWTDINPTTPTTPTASFSTVGAGNYLIRLRIQGTMAGETSPSLLCESFSDPIPISGAPEYESIIVTENTCYNSAIKFKVNPTVPNESYLWTFDTQSTALPLATSTLPITSRVFDPTTDGNAHSVTVTLTIANRYGCTRSLTTTFIIPARCYFGDIATTTPAICKNGSMELHYQLSSSHADNCTVYKYQWMDGSNPIPSSMLTGNLNPTTSSIVTVNGVLGTPFYWVKLLSDSNPAASCNYSTPTRLTPTLLPPPLVQISAPSIVCQGSSGSASLTTNSSDFHWFVDDIQQPETSTSLSLNWFPIGPHTLSVTATTAAPGLCTKTVQQSFTVKASPLAPNATYAIENCDTYRVTLTATPPSGGTGTLNWSTGTPRSAVTVYSGGPYMVTYNDGSGCTSTKQIDVPYSLKRYLWEFPYGCYTMCEENAGTIIGPIVDVHDWHYYNGEEVVSEGHHVTEPFTPTHSGHYVLALSNGLCPEKSPAMDLTVERCQSCSFKDPKVKEVKCAYNGIYYYTLVVEITNTSTVNINTSITVPNNEVTISPVNFVVIPGSMTYSFIVIPLNGFAQGPIHFILHGVDARGNMCTYPFSADFKNCGPRNQNRIANPNSEEADSKLVMFPNPAKEVVNIKFKSQFEDVKIELYDVTGKLLNTYTPQKNNDTFEMPLHNVASGIYIIILKENGQSVMQKKLIIN